jgi:bifunctional non-homologous end joining protein LigD
MKLVFAGQKLKGSWVLVRMKGDRFGGKRTNWLLIKHRDEWAKDGDADKLLNKDRSAASGRTMGQIARGEGKAPESFMLSKSRTKLAKSDAIWHSSKSAEQASTLPRRPRARKTA